MEDLQAFFDKYMKDMQTGYSLHDGIWIIRDFQEEEKIVKEYEGREVFELLQNADDAAFGQIIERKRVIFEFKGDTLTVSNNGAPFSKDGYKSILYRGLSSKTREEGQIGEKGLGFRSLLNWAKEIVIISNGYKVEFSEKIGQEFLKKLFSGKKELERSYENECEKQKLPSNVIAKLVVPKYSRYSETTDFDTIIQIKFEDDDQKSISGKIEDGLNKITKEAMLFMNNIDCIEIETADYQRSLWREKGRKKTIIVWEKKLEGAEYETDCREWHINSKEGDFNGKGYKLSVAWNDDLDDEDCFLYSYFRTKEQLPLPAIIHGTFDLTPDRNRLQDTDKNRHLIDKLTDLLVNTAEELSKKDCSYRPLKFLEFVGPNLGYELQKLGFNSLLDEKRMNGRIFPTVNGKYIRLGDSRYYHDKRIADLLKGDDVDKLLQYCPYDSIYEKRIGKDRTYGSFYFANILNTRLTQIETFGYEKYAYLLKFYLDKYSNEIEFKKPLFIDDDNKPVSWNDTILISDGKYDIQYPKELPIKFINKSLVNSLREVFCVSDNDKLIEKLSKLKVKRFSPFEIMSEISKHYSTIDVTRENVQECHKYLYSLYKRYRSEIKSEEKLYHVKVITATDTFSNAETVYFGNDYGCDITEHLYSFDKSLIIGSLSANGFENNDVNTAKEYFKWLGVAEFPRMVDVDYKGPQACSYVDYLFERWGYGDVRIGRDLRIQNYEDYKRRINPNSIECRVMGIDKLELMLKPENVEFIIAWIKHDSRIKEWLEVEKEDYRSSYVEMREYSCRSNRRKNMEIYNHLCWQFASIPWLNTKSKKSAAPNRCSVSNTITDDFSPLIEKPDVNENAQILKKYKISRKDVVDVLHRVGVANSISDFSTDIVYSVLNKLPEIDPKGEKAKSIYRELATNYDESEINKNNVQYRKYMSDGLVFCKKGYYVNYKEAYYLQNRRWGEAVVNQFDVIAIDYRKSAKNIARIFGVKELKIDSLSLVGRPRLHPLNDVFEKEIKAFKPYVYMFRKEADQNGNNKKDLLDVRFRAVSKLNYEIRKEDFKKETSLGNYEYCYDAVKQCIYVLIPSFISEWYSVRDKVQLGTTIAEAFSSLFDVDTIDTLRELFCRTDSGRQDIIRDRFEDPDLSKFHAVEKELGMTHDYKLNFWKSFLKCFPDKDGLRDIDYSDEMLLADLKNLFPEQKELIEQVFWSISNYADYFADNESTLLLVKLLKECNVSLAKFNEFVYPKLTLDRLYNSEMEVEKSKNKKLFESCMWRDLINKGVSEQKKFCSYKDKYDRISGTIPDTLDYDVKKDLKDEVLKIFRIQLIDDEVLDLVAMYNENKQKLIQESNRSGTYIDEELLVDKDNDSLLYFDSGVDELIRRLRQMEADTEISHEKMPSLSIEIRGSSIKGDSFKELVDKFDKECPVQNVKPNTINTLKIEDYASDNEKEQECHIVVGNGRIKKNAGDYGGLGERFVYNYLERNKEQNQEICWVSDYARKYGCNPNGKDGLGYDICIKEDGKIVRFVEVKVLSNDDAFHITRNEVEVGQNPENRGKYDIYIVRNLRHRQGKPEIEIMETPFKYHKNESFTNNGRFSVINDSYVIRFKRE